MDKTVKIRVVRSDSKEFNIDGTDWRIPSDGLDGFGTYENDITTVDNAVGDGGIIVSDRIAQKDRTIVAKSRNPVLNDILRRAALSFFNSKFEYKIYITYMGVTHWCEGKIYKFDLPSGNVNRTMTMTITFLCPNPFLKSYDNFGKNIASVEGMCGFPFLCYAGERHKSKNLLKNTAKTTTINGVTFTVYEDGSVTVNGIATDKILFNINTSVGIAKGNYIFSGCPNNVPSGCYLQAFGVNEHSTGKGILDTGSGCTVEFATDDMLRTIFIYIADGTTVSDITFYPMIHRAGIEDATYEPYYEPYTTYNSNEPVGITGGRFNFAQVIVLENDGDVDTFCKAVFKASGEVVNPKLTVNGNYVRVIDAMQLGDVITIDFTKNPPTVQKNGENYIGHCDRTSAFDDMALVVGDSEISFDADTGSNLLDVSIYYNKLYGAI